MQDQFRHRRVDEEYIASDWLFLQIAQNRWNVRAVYRVVFTGLEGKAQHLVVLLEGDDAYICDCCLGTNLGVPCRHYFALLRNSAHLRFHLALIRSRQVHPLTRLDLIVLIPLDLYLQLASESKSGCIPDSRRVHHAYCAWREDKSPKRPAGQPTGTSANYITHTYSNTSSDNAKGPISSCTPSIAGGVKADCWLDHDSRGLVTNGSISEADSVRGIPHCLAAGRALLTSLRLCRCSQQQQEESSARSSNQRPLYHDPPIPPRTGRPPTTRLAHASEGRGPRNSGGGGQHYRRTETAEQPVSRTRPQHRPQTPHQEHSGRTAQGSSDSESDGDDRSSSSPPPARPARRLSPRIIPSSPPGRHPSNRHVDIAPRPREKQARRCGICRKRGHNKTTCPDRVS